MANKQFGGSKITLKIGDKVIGGVQSMSDVREAIRGSLTSGSLIDNLILLQKQTRYHVFSDEVMDRLAKEMIGREIGHSATLNPTSEMQRWGVRFRILETRIENDQIIAKAMIL